MSISKNVLDNIADMDDLEITLKSFIVAAKQRKKLFRFTLERAFTVILDSYDNVDSRFKRRLMRDLQDALEDEEEVRCIIDLTD